MYIYNICIYLQSWWFTALTQKNSHLQYLAPASSISFGFLCWKHSGGVWPCCSTEDLGPVVSHPSWVMKRPQMVLIDDLSIANGASSLEFFEHQPCLLLKRYETWFIYSDQLVDFHKTNQPDWHPNRMGPLRSKVSWISKIETAVHSDSPTKLSILSFQDLPFCTFPTDTTPHFSKKSPVDVWQVCTTVLDFLFTKNIDQETAHKDIQRHQAPETSIISEEWRWVKMTRKVDW